jgi:predicted AlkP superfamily pyrophosphatase or phosphodiesterase
VDSALARLVNGLQRQGLRDSTYLILVADHGMVAVTPQEFEAIDQIIDTAGVRIGDSGPFVNLYAPHRDLPKLRDELNRGLKHGRAYLRAEVPERLHYRADPRVGDIVVVMEQPWQAGLATRRPRRAGGNHGWDPTNNPQMYAIFLMSGPGIRRGARIPAFRNVEIYNMLTELLGLTPAPNDGQAGFLVRQVSRKRQ